MNFVCLDQLSQKEKESKITEVKEKTEASPPLVSSKSKVKKAEIKASPPLKMVEPVKLPMQTAPILVDIPEAKTPKKPIVKVKPIKKLSKPGPVEYTVQVFSGRSKRNAENLVKRLKNEGFPGSYIFKHITADSKSLYRVRVGRMKKPEINNLARKIKSLKFIDSTQVTRF